MKTELKLKTAWEAAKSPSQYIQYRYTIRSEIWYQFPIHPCFKKWCECLSIMAQKKNFCFLYPMGATSTWHEKLFLLPVLFCSKPSLLRKLFSSGIWDYFLIVLSFSVCFKFKSLSPAFSGVLWPPILSIKRSATIMYHQWQEFSLFELDPLQLSALYTHSGVGRGIWYPPSVEGNHFLIEVFTEIWFFCWTWGCFL